MDMFKVAAPWENAAREVRVFKISQPWTVRATDAELLRMFSGLRQRNITLGLEALIVPQPTGCGSGVEGFSPLPQVRKVAGRIKALKGSLGYVAMDGPLSYAVFYNGPRACHMSVADAVQAVAPQIAALRRMFPALQVGDIEVVTSATPFDDILRFAAGLAARGQPLSFIHMDVDYGRPNWLSTVRAFMPRIRDAGLKVGIIYRGSDDAQSNIAWTRQATQRFTAVEQDPRFVPDQAILQTWNPYPENMLPDSQDGTMTNLVLTYKRR